VKQLLFFIIAYVLGSIIVQFLLNSIFEIPYNNAVAVLDKATAGLLYLCVYVVFPFFIGSGIELAIIKYLGGFSND
jgi:hypothetical protein